MFSPNCFIINPKDKAQYINTKKIGGKDLIINTSIEEAKDVQRIGNVVSIPKLYNTEVKEGDEVVVNHNVFRITYNDKGIPLESSFYIKDNLFYVEPELVYMAIRNGEKIAVNDNVFVEPTKEVHAVFGEREKQHVGILRYGNKVLEAQGINEGDRVVFRKGCEYEFNIDGEKLYKMFTKRILAKL
jgi:co-chaperonin GroES (HSP10)